MATRLSRNFRGGFWLWLVAAASVMLASGLLYYDLQPRNPRYQGKTSAQWFREFQNAYSLHWTIPVVTPSQPPGTARALDSQALLREPAAAGLRALGTNAAVYLGRQFARQDELLARTYTKWYFRLPAPIKRFLPKPPYARSYLRMEIGWVLDALGPDATAAVPSLITALQHGDGFTVQITLRTLQKLEFDRHQLDPLLADWSKQGQHTNVVLVVSELQVRTPVAARCLAEALSKGDTALRGSCVRELQHFPSVPSPVLLRLIAALKDPDEEVRYGAARALEAQGRRASTAVPALVQATNDTSLIVQRASARALRAIQGQHTD